MTNHRSRSEYAIKMIALKALASSALYSVKDDCVVVPLHCFTCGNRFYELHETAHMHVIADMEPLCIKCDGLAVRVPSGAVMTAIVQWAVSL